MQGSQSNCFIYGLASGRFARPRPGLLPTASHQQPADREHEPAVIANYGVWQVETATPETVFAAAAQGRSDVLLTEDLNSGQTIEGVRIENPFETATQPET